MLVLLLVLLLVTMSDHLQLLLHLAYSAGILQLFQQLRYRAASLGWLCMPAQRCLLAPGQRGDLPGHGFKTSFEKK
jgi:hypothetical protein